MSKGGSQLSGWQIAQSRGCFVTLGEIICQFKNLKPLFDTRILLYEYSDVHVFPFLYLAIRTVINYDTQTQSSLYHSIHNHFLLCTFMEMPEGSRLLPSSYLSAWNKYISESSVRHTFFRRGNPDHSSSFLPIGQFYHNHSKTSIPKQIPKILPYLQKNI